MREEKRRWIGLLSPFAGIIVAFLICAGLIPVQAGEQETDNDQHPRVYNPYPPSIVPSDLSSEIARVLRELDVIESRALARWHALKPPLQTEIKRARLATCRMPALVDRSPRSTSQWWRFPERFTFGPASGQRNDTRIHHSSLYCNTTKYRVYSLVETSSIHARPDISLGFPTPNRHRVLPSTL